MTTRPPIASSSVGSIIHQTFNQVAFIMAFAATMTTQCRTVTSPVCASTSSAARPRGASSWQQSSALSAHSLNGFFSSQMAVVGSTSTLLCRFAWNLLLVQHRYQPSWQAAGTSFLAAVCTFQMLQRTAPLFNKAMCIAGAAHSPCCVQSARPRATPSAPTASGAWPQPQHRATTQPPAAPGAAAWMRMSPCCLP